MQPIQSYPSLVMFFDGSCWPNPGGPAYYGWHVDSIAADGEVCPLARNRGDVTDRPTTNNVAEWRSLAAGLHWLTTILIPIEELVIHGDSQLVIQQINGKWRCKNQQLAAIRDECHLLLKSIGCKWSAVWVPRAQNELADSLAVARLL